MSPAAGVDYLNLNLPYYLELSRSDLAEENFASATAQIFREFSETGTDIWYRKNTEWFLVYLITEVAATPHNIRQGYSVPSLMDAYDSIVHELVSLFSEGNTAKGDQPTDPPPTERAPLRPVAAQRDHRAGPRVPHLP